MDGMQIQDQNCFRFAFIIIVIKERAGLSTNWKQAKILI